MRELLDYHVDIARESLIHLDGYAARATIFVDLCSEKRQRYRGKRSIGGTSEDHRFEFHSAQEVFVCRT